ncbi:MAG TPA: VOC family protein [Fastidiosipila sp.]|nr:VOC family protein [Fastidiosipila sp.]
MKTPGKIEVYLYFDGNCEDALRFYEEVLGGEITYMQKWKDLPTDDTESMDEMPDINPEDIMHANLKIGDVNLMASDNPYRNTSFGDSITLNWSHADASEVKRVWDELAQDGEINMPLEATFFAPLFGQLTDKFSINWQIMQWDEEVS